MSRGPFIELDYFHPYVSDPERPTDRTRPVHLDDEAALDAFVDREPVALVEFYTDGCGICQSMEPVLGNLAKTTDAAIGTVNPRDDPPLIERFQVQSVPLLVVFVDGEPVDQRAEGFVGGEEFRSWLAEYE